MRSIIPLSILFGAFVGFAVYKAFRKPDPQTHTVLVSKVDSAHIYQQFLHVDTTAGTITNVHGRVGGLMERDTYHFKPMFQKASNVHSPVVKAKEGHWSSLGGKEKDYYSPFDELWGGVQLDYRGHKPLDSIIHDTNGEMLYTGIRLDTFPDRHYLDEQLLDNFTFTGSLGKFEHWEGDSHFYFYLGRFFLTNDHEQEHRFLDSIRKYLPLQESSLEIKHQ